MCTQSAYVETRVLHTRATNGSSVAHARVAEGAAAGRYSGDGLLLGRVARPAATTLKCQSPPKERRKERERTRERERAGRFADDNDDCDTKVRSASRRVAANLVIRVDTSARLTSAGALTPAPISDSGDQARALPPSARLERIRRRRVALCVVGARPRRDVASAGRVRRCRLSC